MNNRGEIVDEKDRLWILIESHAITGDWHNKDLMLEVLLVCGDLWDQIGDGWAYSIREALIARKMGLSEGRGIPWSK